MRHTEGATTQKRDPSSIRRGDIYWVVPDEARGSVPSVQHPYVVIQEDVFNRSRIHTVIMCALTTNLTRANEPGNVLLEVGEGQLPKRSVLVVSQVSSIEKTLLGEYIGRLAESRVEQVLDGLRFQQSSFFGHR
jgi:mRNA interferase MazF